MQGANPASVTAVTPSGVVFPCGMNPDGEGDNHNTQQHQDISQEGQQGGIVAGQQLLLAEIQDEAKWCCDNGQQKENPFGTVSGGYICVGGGKEDQCDPEQPVQHGAGNIGGDPDAGVQGYEPYGDSALIEALLSVQQYDEHISRVRSILKGDLRPVREWLTSQMWRMADLLRFEEAERYKQKLLSLEKYQAKSVIVSSKIVDTDIFTLLTEEDDIAYCNFLRIQNGSITAVQTVRLTTGVDSTPEDMLAQAIEHITQSLNITLAKELITNFMPSSLPIFDGKVITIPKRGDKQSLIEFSLRSARIYRAERLKNLEIKNPERHTDRLMEAMRRELHLEKQPRHIECFDNSNLQGTNPVASCVVFRDGKPSKKEYRHFNIKTVEGPDDFASMREIIHRRYSRLIAEGSELPDLIIVDGGKGQLSSAYAILKELGIEKQVPIVGLAKRIEEIFYPNDPMPYYLSRTGEPLKVVCHIRDEAHRFGITFHRQKRSINFISSELEQIKGIGKQTISALLRHFKTVSAIRKATTEELTSVIGQAKAKTVYDYFNTK